MLIFRAAGNKVFFALLAQHFLQLCAPGFVFVGLELLQGSLERRAKPPEFVPPHFPLAGSLKHKALPSARSKAEAEQEQFRAEGDAAPADLNGKLFKAIFSLVSRKVKRHSHVCGGDYVFPCWGA